MTADHAVELSVALAAVRRAAAVCQRVRAKLVSADTMQKKDKSPVTVADFASQAVVCAALMAAFPGDGVVGEEGSAELRTAEQAAIRAAVVEAVRDVLPAADEPTVLAWIDRGCADGSTPRYWTLDPIDGTKGFLRGEQYAVALALIEDHRVVLGVLGCPNLPGVQGSGQLVFAVRGRGAHAAPLAAGGTAAPIRVNAVTSSAAARFCESVESGHSDQSASQQIAARLGITAAPLRMDSQVKYAAVARGDADIYLRLPTRADYVEKIWDHAAGMIVVEEAGGIVTDAAGKPLDFSHGPTLAANRGIIAAPSGIHAAVAAAVGATLKL